MKPQRAYVLVKRSLDLLISLAAAIVLSPITVVVAIMVNVSSDGPILFWSNRVGKNNKMFRMPKFRTMKVQTPSVATHMLKDPKSHLTPIGGFLRKTSLDEIPQLWSVIIGDMSLIGPRPALYNQDDLIKLRTELGIHKLSPGITGWAQINGRDTISTKEKVAFDKEYLSRRSLVMDTKIFYATIVVVLSRKSVSH